MFQSTHFFMQTKHFVFRMAKNDVSCIKDLAFRLKNSYRRITTELRCQLPHKVNVYIYSSLTEYHTAIGNSDYPDWVVGNSHANHSLSLTSPQNPGPASTYNAIIQTAVHEFSHVVVNQIGARQIPKWIKEGLATTLHK
jgi:hypothetical protein